jgi:hypothetical protein
LTSKTGNDSVGNEKALDCITGVPEEGCGHFGYSSGGDLLDDGERVRGEFLGLGLGLGLA